VKQWELSGITTVAGRAGSGVGLAPGLPVPSAESRRSPGAALGTASGLDEGQGGLRLLVDQLPALFWTTDRDLRITAWLGAGRTRLGLGPNQLVGTTLYEVFETVDPAAPPIAAHRWALGGEPACFHLEWRERTFRAWVAPLRDSGREVIGTIGVAVDAEGHQEARAGELAVLP
jgi:PAS domain-containing protein